MLSAPNPASADGSVRLRSFPEVAVWYESAPSSDGGEREYVSKVTIAGKEARKHPSQLLQDIIVHRKGWGPDGKSDDQTIQNVLKLYVIEFCCRGEDQAMKEKWTNQEEAKRLKSEKGSLPAFFLPMTEITKIDKLKSVVYRYWQRKPINIGTWGGGPPAVAFVEVVYAFYAEGEYNGVSASYNAPRGEWTSDS